LSNMGGILSFTFIHFIGLSLLKSYTLN